ncbi:aldehyde dehydrogenase family protein [Paraburkholderia sediminicola]|uniref:aldehyde dehydrogenase family protein n=1 Tax=Paraburkholderia sediminicola TaxID=458836 RepID=UPI0038BBF9E7
MTTATPTSRQATTAVKFIAIIDSLNASNYAVSAHLTRVLSISASRRVCRALILSTANDAEHAIDLANMSVFCLSGAIWTGDAAKTKSFARQLQTGGVFVNGFSASDPRVPIGGIKKNGYGRELSHFGVREFTNAQAVWFDRK